MKSKTAKILVLVLLISAACSAVLYAAPIFPGSCGHDHSSVISIHESTNNAVQQATETYMGNSRVKKFHYLDCKFASMAREENRVYFNTRQEAVDQGYDPCRTCKP